MKNDTKTPIRVSIMRFTAKPEMLESVPWVMVTLRKATHVMLVRALLRMKSARKTSGAMERCFFSSPFFRRTEKGFFLTAWRGGERAGQRAHGHAGEATDQRADGTVQSDPERAFDFRLQADDGCDT